MAYCFLFLSLCICDRTTIRPDLLGLIVEAISMFFWGSKVVAKILGIGNWVPTSHHPGLCLSQGWSRAGHFLGYHAVPLFKYLHVSIFKDC